MVQKGTEEDNNGFELFEPHLKQGRLGGHPGAWLPQVRLDRAGMWHISRPALELLGLPEAVTLWYDAQRGRVGFRAAEKSDEAAYSVRSAGPKSRQGLVSGEKFCNYYGISHEEPKAYPARLEDGLLVIDVVGE